MLRSRLTYGSVLAGAVLFFLCFNGYLSLYVLRVVLALPFISLLLSLPGMLGIQMELLPAVTHAQKTQQVPLRLRIFHRLPFLVSPRGRVTLSVENTLTGSAQRERFDFSATREPAVLLYQLTSPTCGQVLLTLSRARVCDYMGLFSLPIRLPENSRRQSVLFYPAAAAPALTVEQTARTSGEGERYSQKKPGDDPAEIFAFREYREGDRLSRIHWKLSQRVGELQVKELGLPVSDRVFFLLEPQGSGEECDALLDVFATLSGFLAEQEIPHRVAFAPGDAQRLTVLALEAPEDSRPVLDALLLAGARSAPLPVPRRSEIPPGTAHVFYLCRIPQEETVTALRAGSDARLTVVMVGDRTELTSPLADDVELIPVTPGQIAESLNGLSL